MTRPCDQGSGRSLTRRCWHVLNQLQPDAMYGPSVISRAVNEFSRSFTIIILRLLCGRYDVKLAALNSHGVSEESQLFSFFVTGLKRGPGQPSKEKTRRKGAQRQGEFYMFSLLGYYKLLHLQRHVNIYLNSVPPVPVISLFDFRFSILNTSIYLSQTLKIYADLK